MTEERKVEGVDELFDDDIPLADDRIQANYEAALGRCMLAFNQLDNLLGKILRTIFSRLNRQDMEKDWVNSADFSQRVRFLDLLKHSTEGIGIVDVPIDDLRSVAGQRNLLAHAHFEQNPSSGEYLLINRKDEAEQTYTAERIDGVVKQIQKVWNKLRYAEAYYAFCDFPITKEPPPSDSP